MQQEYPYSSEKLPFLDFFAGSGLVSIGFSKYFDTIWANDNCFKKSRIFRSNLPNTPLCTKSIKNIHGTDIPDAVVSWASFPCQDLSLAGNLSGINGSRSGMVWEWLRIMKEMSLSPQILIAENVVGLIKAERGAYYIKIHNELSRMGYRVGPIILDAKYWVPQSRPRIFIIAVKKEVEIGEYSSRFPNWLHNQAIREISKDLDDMVLWKIRKPYAKQVFLDSVIDFDEYIDIARSERNLQLIPRHHYRRLFNALDKGKKVFTGYKRSRQGKQQLEVRFDGMAGCLRTAKGGSSKQYVIYMKNGSLIARIMTPREAARLMGVPENFILPNNKNDAYTAMGDAVAVPVSRFLANNLIKALAEQVYEDSYQKAEAI